MSASGEISRRGLLKAAIVVPLGGGAAAAAGTRERVAFVLVHGAWHGGWCYARVAEILRAQGHKVFTPTLTGLGERSHLATLGIINCSTHIRDVLNVIHWERLDGIVLCGHSYGGRVISGAADAVPERIKSLVYLDAAIPQKGRSELDGTEPQKLTEVLDAAGDHGGHLLPPYPAEFFNVNPADRAMVDALCTPQPIETFIESLNLTGAYENVAKKTFVMATGWKGHPVLRQMYKEAKEDKGWTALEIPYGHDVMLDAPERVAEILLGAM